MGAAFFSNETYRETLPIIDASGLPAIPFSNFSNGNEWLYDPKSGSVGQSKVLPTMTKSPLFQAEVDRYTNFWKTEFAPLAVVGYKVRVVLCDFSVSECFSLILGGVEWCQGVYVVGF
jgi:hypothetical protein